MVIDNKFLRIREAHYDMRVFFDTNFPNGFDLDKASLYGDYQEMHHWILASLRVHPERMYVRDESGEVISMTDDHGVTCLFDKDGNITKISYIAKNGDERSWEYEYDNNGNKTRVYDPVCVLSVYSYEYDKNFNMTRKEDPYGNVGTWSYEYDHNKNVVRRTNSSGDHFDTEYEYDRKGRLIKANDLVISYLKELL